MGNVLRMEKQQQIQALIKLGWSVRAVSRHTGIDRETVTKYRTLANKQDAQESQNPPKVPTDHSTVDEQNQPEVPADLPAAVPTNSQMILPYLAPIRTFFLQHLSAQRIYQDLVEQHGFRGSYDCVKRYVRKLRKRTRQYTERLSHLPGREAQVDFGKATCRVLIDGRQRRPWLFKMTLSCSKHAYEELVERQDLETFLRCHERAFRFFGGVPEIVTLDNIKSGVILASLFEPILNRTYLAFATHWGFAANPCIPRTPEHKGVVERDIGYTKHNALDKRVFESLEEANAFLRHWNKRWARTRIHGTTKCQVWKMFCELEQSVLKALVEKDFEFFHTGRRIVGVDGLIEVEARYYALPPGFLGQSVIVHYNQQWIKIFDGDKLVITHRRLILRGRVSQPPSCLPRWKHPDRESLERYYCRKAKETGPGLHHLVYQSLCANDPLAIRRVRGLLDLAKRFPKDVVEEAADRARTLHSYSYHIVKGICEHVNEQGVLRKSATLTQQHELIRPLSEYESVITERTTQCQ